jgi:signal transduction histidine kinase
MSGEAPFAFDELMDHYSDALLDYLVQPGEPSLLAAQRLGQNAIGKRLGLTEMAAIHHEVLKTLLLRMLMDETPAGSNSAALRLRRLYSLLRSLTPQESVAAFKAAESFFTSSIGPYEVRHRQFQEATAAMNQRNSKLEEQAGRIASALYDDTLQLLAAANLALHQIASQLPQGDSEDVSRAAFFLNQIESQLVKFSFELRPYILDNVGLDAAIRTAASYFSKMARIDISVEAAPPGPLSWSLATILYRAVQEVLTNVCEHAHATHVSIQLECEGEVIRCCIRDNGIGFEPSQVFSARGELGLGLIGIRESVRLLGGTIAVQSGPGRGTELRISTPRKGPSSN